MSKDPIRQVGDPVLRQKAKSVPPKEVTSPKIKKLIADMKQALAHESFGVAIAAPQLGVPLRIFIIAGKAFARDDERKGAPSDEDAPTPPDIVFINPQMIRLSKKMAEMSEGCLSVRGKYGSVMRHQKATLKALDEHGKPFTYHGSGLIGHIFQHEYDHLEGVLYVDKAIKLVDDEELQSAAVEIKNHGK